MWSFSAAHSLASSWDRRREGRGRPAGARRAAPPVRPFALSRLDCPRFHGLIFCVFAAPPRVDSWSVKDIEREILSLSDTYPAQPQGGAAVAGGGGEAPLLQRQMSGGAAAPDADMMVNGRGKGSAERVAASPQSNGSKNFTNERHDVPKIDLAGVAPTSVPLPTCSCR